MDFKNVWTLRLRGQLGAHHGVFEKPIIASTFDLAEKTGQQVCADRGWRFISVEPWILCDETLLDKPRATEDSEPPQLERASIGEQRDRIRNRNLGA